ncbi:phytoene/squalene synthase family protein [Alkalihalobacterium chitinilyticum]|uniref:Phytoene/squalene synthase family protein n=1 Tax=Alkalihalobacterium chitinilyticum TaxID=2980103 RepID=A0ABT5VAD6_9BACI|nr:phytoene/squalene synthase family protein [Alkalihalobacterium chitinilyticum]MDE5412081.1 phytoene/squalene synthase family protein [Alkalihalobacterium chitinilyticum]
MKQIEKAYESCRVVIERHSKSFAKAFNVLPSEKRKAVWAVYAFCRRVDDIVDNGGTLEELHAFKTEFELFLGGSFSVNDDMWVALNDVFQRYSMEAEPFFDMIRGQEMDFEVHHYPSLEQLEQYSYYVASSVGLMLLPILAPSNNLHLKSGAISLGLAMQLTNILRDVGEDLERGRVYIPADLMEKHNYTREELIKGEINDNFIGLWEDIATRAEQLYDIALPTIENYPMDARFPVKAALHFYRHILNSVRKNKYNCFTTRAYVSDGDKRQLLQQIMTSQEALA